MNKISKNINFVGDFNPLPIALKNSVSSLIVDDETYVVTHPKNFTIDEHTLNSHTAEIGTLYHRALEKLNFEEISSVKDVKNFLGHEFDMLDSNKLYSCCMTLKKLFNGKQVLKEKKFVMKVPYNEVVINSKSEEEIVVQGMIDCFSKSGILVDYKYTKLKDKNSLRKRYSKQLELYKKALQLGFGLKEIKCYLLLIDNAELIEV